MFKENSKNLTIMLWTIILVLLALSSIKAGSNPDDAYWHVKVGEWILEHRQVPTSGIFSYTAADQQWVSHEWLSAVFLYLLFHYSGWGGLVFFSLIILLTSLLLLLCFLLKRLSAVQSMIFVLFAYLLIIPHILPRPHILAIPIMIYWTASLIEASERQKSPSIYLAPLMVLWVNMHGSFIIGIAFSLFFAAETVFYAQSIMRKQMVLSWSKFILAVILAATITPHGLHGLLLPFQLSNQDYALSMITEWLSPNFHEFQPLELWLLSFLALTLFQGIKLPVFRLVFLLGLIHLSLKHIRHACDLLSVLSPLILATPLAQHWKSETEISFKQLIPNYKGVLLLAIYFTALFFYLTQVRVIQTEQDRQIESVLIALKDDRKNLGNVLNDYGAGDFLIHHDYQVFIDPRSELYGDKFMKDYFDAIFLSKNSERLENILRQYQIQWTIFQTSAPINTYLATKADWTKLYSDAYITLFIRRSMVLQPQTLTEIKKLEQQSLKEKHML